jgi:hypothetical protein
MVRPYLAGIGVPAIGRNTPSESAHLRPHDRRTSGRGNRNALHEVKLIKISQFVDAGEASHSSELLSPVVFASRSNRFFRRHCRMYCR